MTRMSFRPLAVLTLALLATISGCSGPEAVKPDPKYMPYPRGQFVVPQPRRALGVDLCGVLSHEEKVTLVGENTPPDTTDESCSDLHGDRGFIFINVAPFNIDVASEVNIADRPAYRDTVRGNSAWITPGSDGCYVAVAIDPSPAGLDLSIGGGGSFTCDQLHHAAELVIDRLPHRL